jgi:hypothetical protein
MKDVTRNGMSDEALLRSPRTAHLVGSGIPGSGDGRARLDWSALAGRHVVLEEKIDGSEVSFHFDCDARLLCRERSSEIEIAARGGRQRHLDVFKDWLSLNEDRLFDRIGDRYLVYAEWCAFAHRIFYDRLPSYLVECDVQDKHTGEFLSTRRRIDLLRGLEIVHAPVLFEGGASAGLHPRDLVTRSAFCSDGPCTSTASDGASLDLSGEMEGIYGKIEEDGRVVARFKWIRADFVRAIIEGGVHWRDRRPVANLLAS